MGLSFPELEEANIRETDVGERPFLEHTIECAANLIESYKGKVTFVTGAGISSHALPTFRSNDHSGLWDLIKGSVLMKSHFHDNEIPAWRLAGNIRSLQLQGALKPSLAHVVIHELICRGYVSTVITQNVDCLHNFPGDEDRVIELHGSISNFGECEKCHEMFPVDYLKILQDVLPRCSRCGTILKPPVAFFEDIIPRDCRIAAMKALNETEVLFLVGTHCAVDPVASMVGDAKRRGVIIVEINTEKTCASPIADIILRDTADNVLHSISKLVMGDFKPMPTE